MLQYTHHQHNKEYLMKHEDCEVLIVRNTTVHRLYDVVRVDYMKEDVEFIAQALEYEDAVSLVLEIEETN
jgi:hypothetical protein